MSGLYEGVRKDRKAKKDMWVFSLVGAVAFLLVVVVLSYISDRISLEKVVIRYLVYGEDETGD